MLQKEKVGDDILQKDRLINGIIERLTNNFELKPSEVYVLLDYVKQLQEENKELKEQLEEGKGIELLNLDTDKKKGINYQKPFAIKYMLDNKRLYGTEWYCKLKCLEKE